MLLQQLMIKSAGEHQFVDLLVSLEVQLLPADERGGARAKQGVKSSTGIPSSTHARGIQVSSLHLDRASLLLSHMQLQNAGPTHGGHHHSQRTSSSMQTLRKSA